MLFYASLDGDAKSTVHLAMAHRHWTSHEVMNWADTDIEQALSLMIRELEQSPHKREEE